MKKLLSIIFLLIVFSCQDSSNELQSNIDEVSIKNSSFLSKSLSEMVVDPKAATRMSLTEEEFTRSAETCKQLILILNDLADEMPESLKNSDDWLTVMKFDPNAAKFGEKLKAKVDELPPAHQPNCDDLGTVLQIF